MLVAELRNSTCSGFKAAVSEYCKLGSDAEALLKNAIDEMVPVQQHSGVRLLDWGYVDNRFCVINGLTNFAVSQLENFVLKQRYCVNRRTTILMALESLDSDK